MILKMTKTVRPHFSASRSMPLVLALSGAGDGVRFFAVLMVARGFSFLATR
jgi:hypothetical protein